MFGLLCNREGCPVAVEVFDGNTADPNTVGAHIEKLRQRFALSRVVLVGDRGMLTEARIREEVAPAGFDWISALRAPAIRELMSSGAVQRSMFDETDLAEIRCDAYPGERLIVCRNERLAQERARKREALLQGTEKLRQRFALSRVVLVGDRGMLTEARIREEVAPAGFDWISALRAPAIRELMKRSMFDETDLAEIRRCVSGRAPDRVPQ